jgi:4-amino-4-deoxy-L-arabinose transferase-like glycosyltransferase
MNRKLLLILLVGLLIRGALLIHFADAPLNIWDERDYNRLAVSLATRGEFAFTAGTLSSARPPLYPALVSVLYRLFGVENWLAVRIFQLILSLAIVYLAYWLGRMAYGERIGLWTAGFLCFYPTFLGYTNLLLTELLFTFILCLIALAVLRAFRNRSLAWLSLVGFLIGLGALARSILWLFPPVFGLFVLIVWPVPFWRRILGVALLCCSFSVTIAPWVLRNTRVQHTTVIIDVMGGRNFMMGNYEYTPIARAWDAANITGDQYWGRVLAGKHPEAAGMTQGQIDKLALRAGIDFAISHPGLTLKRDLVKFFNFWQLERELIAGAVDGNFGPIAKPALVLLAAAILASYAGLIGLASFGVFLRPPEDRRFHGFLILLIGHQCLIYSLSFAHSRYHVPCLFILALYAAPAMLSLRELWRRWRSRSFIAATICFLIIAASWVWEVVATDLAFRLDRSPQSITRQVLPSEECIGQIVVHNPEEHWSVRCNRTLPLWLHLSPSELQSQPIHGSGSMFDSDHHPQTSLHSRRSHGA